MLFSNGLDFSPRKLYSGCYSSFLSDSIRKYFPMDVSYHGEFKKLKEMLGTTMGHTVICTPSAHYFPICVSISLSIALIYMEFNPDNHALQQDDERKLTIYG